MTKVAAFAVHLPRLSATQVAKLLDWVEHRCVDSHIVTGAHSKDDLYAVLLEARDERNLKNLLCTNFKNWDIKKPTYQRGWFECLTVDEYLAAAGPSDYLRQLVRQTVQSVVEKAVERLNLQRHRRERRLAQLVDAVEPVIAKISKACIASAWGALAAPVRLRKENEHRAQIAEPQRKLEAEKRQREEEEAKQKKKEAEWDAKRARLSKELRERTGLYGHSLPHNMENIETLDDIPLAKALLRYSERLSNNESG